MKEKANGNRGTYRLADSFFRFWYTFGFANLSELEDGDVEGVYKYAVEPELSGFAAMPFEDICRAFVRELQKDDALPFRYSEYPDTAAKFYYALFSKSGFAQKVLAQEDLLLYSLEDIVGYRRA